MAQLCIDTFRFLADAKSQAALKVFKTRIAPVCIVSYDWRPCAYTITRRSGQEYGAEARQRENVLIWKILGRCPDSAILYWNMDGLKKDGAKQYIKEAELAKNCIRNV